MTKLGQGSQITVVTFEGIKKVLLIAGPVAHTWNASARVFRERKSSGSLYPIKQLITVRLEPKDEGVTWARGWDTEASGALRAQLALQRSTVDS